MLVIRKQQVQAFENEVRDRIKAQAMGALRNAALRGALPSAIVLPPDAPLRALFDRAEPRIDRYFGDFRRDAGRFVLLMLEFGEGFDADSWAAQILEDPEIAGPGKLDVLAVHAEDRRRRGSAH